MKKLVSVLLMLALLCGVTAMAECAHTNATFQNKGYQEQLTLVGHGDGTHTRTFKVFHTYLCNDCGVEFSKYLEDGEEHEACVYKGNGVTCDICKLCNNHEFEKSVCKTCGYECGHADSTKKSYGTWVNAVYTNLGNTVGHHAKYDYADVYDCNTCGARYTVIVDTGREDEEPHEWELRPEANLDSCRFCGAKKPCDVHSFDDKGICTVCGYECSHADSTKQDYGSWVNAVYTNLGNTVGHHAKYDYADVYDCNTCGTRYTVIVDTGREDEEPHEWELRPEANLDSCRFCGAKKPCDTHTKSSVISTTNGTKTYVSTADGHTASYTSTTEYKCDVCDGKFTETQNVTEAQQKHSFNNSICTVCNYTCTHTYVDGVCSACGFGCAHENAAHNGRGTSKLVSAEDHLDGTHTREFEVWHNYECPSCKYVFEKFIEMGTETEEHNFGHDGSKENCVVCGAKKACDTHTKGKVVSTTSSTKTYASTAEGHTASFTRTTVYNCSVCGWNYSEVENVTEPQAKHSFSGSTCTVCDYTCSAHSYADGVCSVCGKTCAHENAAHNGTGTSKLKSFVDHHDGTHTRTFEVWHNYECPTCKYVYEKYIEMGTETETHEYGKDGTCHVCGAKPACATHTKSSVIEAKDGEKTYKSENATQHYATFERTTLYNCDVCGWKFSETATVTTELEAHTFEDSVCTVCAHKCEHLFEEGSMSCPYCGVQAPTKVQETTVEKAFEKLPEESKEALAEVGLDTAEKITEKLTETVVEQGFVEEQVEIVDVTLQVQVTDKETGKETWVEVTPDNFPDDGLEVTFDPPAGTNVNDYNFVVVHMFTSPEKAGQTEVLTPTVRDGKLVVKFTALSPVSISWKAKPQSAADLPQTGDDSMMLLWAALLTVSCTALVMKKRSRA